MTPVLLLYGTDREPEIRELSKQLPLAVGRHSTNDIQIDEPGVEIIHCRISWNRRAFEVLSATDTGVLVNSKVHRNKDLQPGDQIVVGSMGLWYFESREEAEAALRSPSESEIPTAPANDEAYGLRAEGEVERARPPLPRQRTEPTPESLPEIPEEEYVGKRLDRLSPSYSEEFVTDKSANKPDTASMLKRWGTPTVRPGEQEVLRSPLVQALGSGLVVLLITALTLWFVIGRNLTQKAYEGALADFDQQRWGSAISRFEEFLKQHPTHSLSHAARRSLGVAKIEQAIAGASANWPQGLELLVEFIRLHRRDKDFPEIQPRMADLALRIGKGSAEAAGAQKKPDLINTATEASRVLQQLSPADNPPKESLASIDEAIQKARAAILKYDTLQATLKEMDAGLAANKPFTAFEARRKILIRYADLIKDKDIQSRLTKALQQEQALSKTSKLEVNPETTERAPLGPFHELRLLRQTRVRSDLDAGETNVSLQTGDSLIALDSLTGTPRWQRVLGNNSTFSPIPLNLNVLAWLVWDSRNQELMAIRQRDGQLLWRTPLSQKATAAPLVYAGQIFLPTGSGQLWQFDQETGRVIDVLQFSQPVKTTPVVINEGQRLAIAGEQGVVYTLAMRPLGVTAVSYIGQASGSLVVSPVRMGDFLLTAENDRTEESLLKVWDTKQLDKPYREVASARIRGLVRDPPVLRGKQLIVPSNPERLAAFTVSDEKDDKALTLTAQFQVDQAKGGPIHLMLGPDDQLWSVSSKLLKLTIGASSLLPVGEGIRLGLSTRPVQFVDNLLYSSSRNPTSLGTYLSGVDRNQMVTQWQLVTGATPLAMSGTAAGDGAFAVVNDTGDVFAVTPQELANSDFESRPVASLPVPATTTTPLRAVSFPSGRIAAWCGAPQPVLWWLNLDGIVARELKLPAPLQAPPIPLAGGILLPLPGKLSLREATGFTQPVEDLIAPVKADQKDAWRTVLAVDDQQGVAVSQLGRVVRFQVRSEPVPHVGEVAAMELNVPVTHPAALAGKTLLIPAGQQLLAFDVGTFSPLGKIEFPTALRDPFLTAGDFLLASTAEREVTAWKISVDLPQAWKLRLPEGENLVGASPHGMDHLVLVQRSGEMTVVKAGEGSILKRVSLKRRLALGPVSLSGRLCVGTLDGTLMDLQPWLEANP